MSGKIGSYFLGLDIFGHPIGVHYRGRSVYQTKLGALCTILSYALMLVNTVTLFNEF